jgi:hypothetical protein
MSNPYRPQHSSQLSPTSVHVGQSVILVPARRLTTCSAEQIQAMETLAGTVESFDHVHVVGSGERRHWSEVGVFPDRRRDRDVPQSTSSGERRSSTSGAARRRIRSRRSPKLEVGAEVVALIDGGQSSVAGAIESINRHSVTIAGHELALADVRLVRR